jgi:methyl-accepting chemotaxis protein/methyl-accepting chemotaxis protein-1 (serine sensor receptor)
MTIQKKLYLAFGGNVLVSILLAVLSVWAMQRMTAAIVDLSQRSEDATYDAGQIDTITSDLQAAQRGMLMRSYASQDAASRKLIEDNLNSVASIHQFVQRYQPLVRDPEVLAKLQVVSDNLATLDRLNPAFLDQVRAKNLEAAVKSLDAGLAQATDNANSAAADLLDLQQKSAHWKGLEMVAEAARDNWIILSMLVPILALGILLVFVIRSLTRQLQESALELAASADQISAAASQVAQSSQSLAQGASEQAATIQETSAASAEINSMAQRATDSARSTAEVVTRSQEGSQRTNASLEQMINAMDGINSSSQKISKIIKVIDEIAFQTNILALNAAVEAARAGEAGMGFAVVADEVRSLAQRCAQAARDTADLIEESVQRSGEGRSTVDIVAQSTRNTAADSGKIKILIDEISLGSQEQSRGIEQITRSIQQLETVTQGNAAGAEQSAAAAEQLTAQAESMRDAVRRLRSLVVSSNYPMAA